MTVSRPLVLVPGDEPPMIAGSKHLDRIRERADLAFFDSHPVDDEEKVARAKDATVILNTRGIVRWPGNVLRRLPKLKLIVCCAIGFDCIDMATARELGVTVCNVPGRTATMVAEHALALLLGASRSLAWMTSEIKRGRWPGKQLLMMSGKRLGVVGTGNIGCEMIRLGKAIGMDVVAWSFNPSPEKAERHGFRYVELDELLATSDAVSVHLKLTAESRGLIDAAAFAKMKRGAVLINTARGAIVDHGAMIAALNSGQLAAVGLDVFDREPLPADDPLLACPQVVLTSHAADALPEAFDALSAGGVENVLAFLDGRPTNVVS